MRRARRRYAWRLQSNTGVQIPMSRVATKSWPVHGPFSGRVEKYAFLCPFGRSGLRPSLVRGDSPRNAPLNVRPAPRAGSVQPCAACGPSRRPQISERRGRGRGRPRACTALALCLSQRLANSFSQRWHEFHAKRFPPQEWAATCLAAGSGKSCPL